MKTSKKPTSISFLKKIPPPLVEGLIEALPSAFEKGYYADKVIEHFFKRNKKWGGRDRRFFAETFYDIVRWWKRILFCLRLPVAENDESFGPVELGRSDYRAIVEFWVFKQIGLTLKDPVMSQSELNRALEVWHRNDLPADISESMPLWLWSLGKEELGERWDHLVAAMNKPAIVYLRVNTLKTSKDDLIDSLQQDGIFAEEVESLPTAVFLPERKNVFGTSSFKKGEFEVQDGGSQRVVPLVQPEPGFRVVDACAGGGGKTLHLATLMRNKGKIIAMDVMERKLQSLKKRVARAGVDIVEPRKIDGTKTIKRLKGSADRVLLDVPCTGLGVLKRNPDSKWKLNRGEVLRLRDLQAEILFNYSKMVKAGGKMVYATCSFLPSENENQISEFLKEHSEWTLEEEVRVWPDKEPMDGFYAARMVRR